MKENSSEPLKEDTEIGDRLLRIIKHEDEAVSRARSATEPLSDGSAAKDFEAYKAGELTRKEYDLKYDFLDLQRQLAEAQAAKERKRLERQLQGGLVLGLARRGLSAVGLRRVR